MFTFHGVFADDVFADYLRRLTEIGRRPGRRVLIYDIRDSGMVPAHQRRMQAEWMKAHEDLTRVGTAGMVFVPAWIMAFQPEFVRDTRTS